ncbi:hypothetical protein JIN84_17970 [Luteolibacter yonseiensis]|uniref:Uncharacterized protein n=1 Tax=Luteolibacter yonseiensis TaxID=1144680 RepID=A0A934R7T3_9BACT|nr:hypothetical protein [Luteolibacter yonseiensis]MBK1817513.1 hypothetical protein [Luteolibacter yonseiensis]
MELKKFTIGSKAIKFAVVLNPESKDENVATEERNVTAHEEPLPELPAAFGKLPPVFCEIMELPAEYATGLSVTGFTISHTKQGTRSVKLHAKKQLETRTDFLHPMSSPMIQIDKPADGESGDVQLKDPKMLKALNKAIKEAENYAGGKRSQKLLNFNEGRAGLQALADQGQSQLGFGS